MADVDLAVWENSSGELTAEHGPFQRDLTGSQVWRRGNSHVVDGELMTKWAVTVADDGRSLS